MRRHGFPILVLFAFLAMLGLAGPASAQTDYTPEQIVTISNPNPRPCEVVTIAGSGFEPGEEIPISANGQLIGTAIAGPDGTFSFEYTVPCDASGTITFTIGTTILTASVLTSTATSTTVATPLPTTGSDSTRPLASLGVLLVTGGGVLVLGSRSRRERSR